MYGIHSQKRCWLAAIVAAAASPAAFAQFVEPDVRVLYTLTSDQQNDQFGWVASAIGDIDGDGASELVIGAPANSAGGPQAGKAFVYSGRSGALLNTVTGSALNRLGHATAGVGDVDADGVPDYALGGPGPGGAPVPGRVLVLSGRTHAVLIDRTGPHLQSAFGADIDGAGDINHDGHDDLIVGAPFHFLNGALTGSAHLISGKDGSTIRFHAWPGSGAVGPIGSRFGSGVSRVRDQNHDGIDDYAVGAPDAGENLAGEAYVLSGTDGALIRVLKARPTGSSFGDFFVHDAGDVNGDGCGDIFVGDFGDNELGPGAGLAYVFFGGRRVPRLFRPEVPGDGLGPGRGAGDVNKDGYDDLIVAAYLSAAGAPAGGKLYVVSGRNNKVLRTMTGNVAGELLGFDVLPVGDVNGDHRIDFLVTGARTAHLILGNRMHR